MPCVKLAVFDRVVTIVPGIDKNTSVDDVFEHVINGVRVLFLREKGGHYQAADPAIPDKTLRVS